MVSDNDISETGMQRADTVLGVSATIRGVSDALAYRAEAEDDDMLALMADVLYTQADALRKVVR